MAAKKKLSGTTEKAAGLFQFKITLLGVEPAIWRRIVVADCTLDEFHGHIQTSMGWTNSHLHQFTINKKLFGDPQLLGEEAAPLVNVRGFGLPKRMELGNSRKTMLSEILPADGKRFKFSYLYDMGDGWEHEVKFEGCLEKIAKVKAPVCLEGERACPPEDCGGAWGYMNLLEAIHDEEHEDHEHLVEWIGGSWDAEAFSAQKATTEMRKGLPDDWRALG